ncbi:hypothetical protein SDC9_175001 [bioreactor metagenome]|uniref:Uncharacterized protein n=1 Tax=bioreactor metagenome TaxID=1076179 RepID=A0A645GL00_9ZZZZ
MFSFYVKNNSYKWIEFKKAIVVFAGFSKEKLGIAYFCISAYCRKNSAHRNSRVGIIGK